MLKNEVLTQKFLELPSSDQMKLRVFMSLMSVNNMLVFIMSQFRFGIFSWVGILLNIPIFYWSIDIKRATSFYYRFIIWSFWVVLIFNGLHLISSILRYPNIEISVIGSVANLLLVCFFGRSILRYRKALIESGYKSVEKLPTLTLTEGNRIRFWVRVIGILLIVWGMMNWAFSDWLRTYGIPSEELVVISMGFIAAVGLLLFRQNLGRRFCLFSHMGRMVACDFRQKNFWCLGLFLLDWRSCDFLGGISFPSSSQNQSGVQMNEASLVFEGEEVGDVA